MDLMARFQRGIQHGWNAFLNKDPTPLNQSYVYSGRSYSHRPDRPRFSRGTERTIVTSVCNKIAMDVAAVKLQHCKLDENDRFVETIASGLNECLTVEANLFMTQ